VASAATAQAIVKLKVSTVLAKKRQPSGELNWQSNSVAGRLVLPGWVISLFIWLYIRMVIDSGNSQGKYKIATSIPVL
jgi:hypothetical protein